MNKLIWKGIDSSTIKGLLICELPPITKPKMRVQETVVDGVDGSIIEELGYESYDKTIKIGLTYDFDIDEVIKYFSGEGEVVFSNEPDKYYKASILNRIDYERLLRFREATVKFRVQPFKYQYQEEKLVAKTGSIEGTEIKVSDVKAIQLQIDGESTQDGTPTPNTPVEIKSVGYENLFDKDNYLTIDVFINASTYAIQNSTNSQKSAYIKVKPNTKYYISDFNFNAAIVVGAFTDIPKIGDITTNYVIKSTTMTDLMITTGDNDKYLVFMISNATTTTDTSKMQIVKGSKKKAYIPYGKYGIEVETVGKNRLQNDLISQTKNGITVTINEDKSITFNGTTNAYTEFILSDNLDITLKNGIKYILSTHKEGTISGGNSYFNIISSDKTELYVYNNNTSVNSMTPSADINIIKSNIVFGANCVLTNFTIYPMLEENQDMTEYQPYQERTSVIELNAPLRSLPNRVKDIAYIRNNKLYVDRKVGTVVLDGSEGWDKIQEATTSTDYYYAYTSVYDNVIGLKYTGISNNFIVKQGTYITASSTVDSDMLGVGGTVSSKIRMFIKKSRLTEMTTTELKTWLSTHNTQVDYELATPVTEEYGDITILKLVDGENNISNSFDANMVVDYVDNKLIISNLGNYISKPMFEIEGAGTIVLIVNDYSVFSYNFDADGRVVIDSEKEDAYLGSVLKNRNMNGEFPKLEIGENKITWDGLVKNIKVAKKSRWL